MVWSGLFILRHYDNDTVGTKGEVRYIRNINGLVHWPGFEYEYISMCHISELHSLVASRPFA